MSLVKGNFTFQKGANELAEIGSFDFSYDVETSTPTSLQGRKYTIEGAHSVSIDVEFLESDVPSLAVAVPQYHVPNGGTLASGEVVNDPAGAIDITPTACDDDAVETDDLFVYSCGAEGERQVMRILDCKTRISGMSLDDNIRKVTVNFSGFSTTSTVQFYKEGAIDTAS